MSTDKVDTEIPSPAAGVLTKIVAQEDDTVEVGGELAVIGEAGEGRRTRLLRRREEHAARGREARRRAGRKPEPAAEEAGTRARAEKPSPPRQSSGGGESTSVKMPELGESVTEGTVTRWLKKVGDSVEVDEPLVEVSTDKVDTEIPSPVAGTLLSHHRRGGRHRRRRRRTGQDRRRGRCGGRSRARAEARTRSRNPNRSPSQNRNRSPSRSRAPRPSPNPSPNPSRSPSRNPPRSHRQARIPTAGPYVTPLVRKLAAENDIDLASVKGTGVGGRIRKQDVLAAAEAKKAPAAAGGRAPRPRQLPPAATAPAPRPRWRTCAAPRRRPTGSGRSPRRRHANPCRPQRN